MTTATNVVRASLSERLAPHQDEKPGRAPYSAEWATRIARLTGGCVLVFALLTLAERVIQALFLNGPVPGLVQMKADTAVAFSLTAAALVLSTAAPSAQRQRLARLLAIVAIVLATSTLVEYLLGVGAVEGAGMAVQTAIDFLCLGLALWLLNTANGTRKRLVPIMAGTSFTIALFAAVGYTFGVSALDGVAGTSTVALSTAIAFLLLSAGIAAASQNCAFGAILTSGGPGAVVLQRMLPTSILIFPIFGFLVFEGERDRLYSLASGLAFFVLASTVVLALVVLSLARRLNWLDRERHNASVKATRLAALVDASNDAIMSSDAHGIITTCNPALEQLYGYTESELVGQPVSILTPPDRMLEQYRLMQAAARGETSTQRDTQRLHKDGSLLDVSVTFSRVMEAGVSYGCCAVTHEIGGRVRAHDRLVEAVRDGTHELSRSRAETLHSLALAAEYRDYDTAMHTTRVGENSALLAAGLGLPERFVELIRQAAPLHDVGKIGIPDHILLKPSALTSEEFAVMKEHTVVGSRLLARSQNEILQLGEVIALAHHERWDGKGYPAGLAGEAIPIAARIVAVADTFDAMTHDRPYRPACSIDEALTEISSGSGIQFDPRVADAFIAVRRQGPEGAARPGPGSPTRRVGAKPRARRATALAAAWRRSADQIR